MHLLKNLNQAFMHMLTLVGGSAVIKYYNDSSDQICENTTKVSANHHLVLIVLICNGREKFM